MGFFKKRGKPRQYRITCRFNTFSDHMLYELTFWNGILAGWSSLSLRRPSDKGAREMLRQEAAFDAKVKGYGDNYEITELI